MKKVVIRSFFYIFMISFMFIILPDVVNADYKASWKENDRCKLHTSPLAGNCVYANTNFNSSAGIWLNTGDIITVITSVTPVPAPTTGQGSECPTTFSKVSNVYNGKVFTGWACTDNIVLLEIPDELAVEFAAAGFPASYWPKLATLKQNHPDWQFVAIDTELDFNTAVTNEIAGNRSLIQGNAGLLSTLASHYDWATDKWKVGDGANTGEFVTHTTSKWLTPSTQTIAYFMDPRNFLSDQYIFQFETLAYNPAFQNLEGVKKVLGNSYISIFAEHFITAAEKTELSPIYLAALSKQEVGGGTEPGRAVSGLPFTYDNKYYAHSLYNFYNIGATSGENAVLRGLVNANGGADGSNKTQERPWTTEEKAIIGGAMFTAERYFDKGQSTSYFKKFNVVYNYSIKNGISNPYANYTHQYMQNIKAPSAEAVTTYNSYRGNGLLDSGFTFYIPVYKNMPEETQLPPNGNPNNRLKSLNINDKLVEGFVHDKFSYTVQVDNGIKEAKITTTTINANAKVTGTGTFKLDVGTNTFNLEATAQNGAKQTYTVNVVRAPAPGDIVHLPIAEILEGAKITTDGTIISGLTFTTEVSEFRESILEVDPYAEVTVTRGTTIITTGNLRTGDVIKIVSGDEEKTFAVVLFGDTNGDGTIDVADLLRVQRHIAGESILSNAYFRAADSNRDGRIDVADLLRVQRHIVSESFINQN